MSKNAWKGLVVVLGAMFLYGCAGTAKSFEVRRYVQEKDRVDQSMEGGNAGYLAGTPQPEDRSGFKKTRKTYVIEVSTGQEIIERDTGKPVVPVVAPRKPAAKFDAAVIQPEYGRAGKAVESPSLVEYRVLKDDTLQKISKKFYDSYSAWPRIYEVNRNVIENPDRIKPGTVIQIPME